MNFVHIEGYLGADPEVRFTSTGKKVTVFRVGAKARKGAADETIWWKVTVWGEQYDKMISFLKKGSAVIVFGELQKPEIFVDREGKSQISMEVKAFHLQFTPFGKPADGASSRPNTETAPQASSGFGAMPSFQSPYSSFGGQDTAPTSDSMANASKGDSFDDEVPF